MHYKLPTICCTGAQKAAPRENTLGIKRNTLMQYSNEALRQELVALAKGDWPSKKYLPMKRTIVAPDMEKTANAGERRWRETERL